VPSSIADPRRPPPLWITAIRFAAPMRSRGPPVDTRAAARGCQEGALGDRARGGQTDRGCRSHRRWPARVCDRARHDRTPKAANRDSIMLVRQPPIGRCRCAPSWPATRCGVSPSTTTCQRAGLRTTTWALPGYLPTRRGWLGLGSRVECCGHVGSLRHTSEIPAVAAVEVVRSDVSSCGLVNGRELVPERSTSPQGRRVAP
jgi:hypothetical protein